METGWEKLDKMCAGGFKKGELTMLVATGRNPEETPKSFLTISTLNILKKMKSDAKVAFMLNEVTKEEVMEKNMKQLKNKTGGIVEHLIKNPRPISNRKKKFLFFVGDKTYVGYGKTKDWVSYDPNKILVYKDGNRLGWRKRVSILKCKEVEINRRLLSIQNGSAEFLSSDEIDNIIKNKKGV